MGKTTAARPTVFSPIGRLIQKIHSQPKRSISQPPSTGPKTGPSNMGIPSTANTRPSRAGPDSRVSMVKTSGISIPPPRPCITRKAMRAEMFGANAHSRDPALNASSEAMKGRLVPNRSATQPASGITAASASV